MIKGFHNFGRLPFTVFQEEDLAEDLRLKYRFLDLRRLKIHSNIMEILIKQFGK